MAALSMVGDWVMEFLLFRRTLLSGRWRTELELYPCVFARGAAGSEVRGSLRLAQPRHRWHVMDGTIISVLWFLGSDCRDAERLCLPTICRWSDAPSWPRPRGRHDIRG